MAELSQEIIDAAMSDMPTDEENAAMWAEFSRLETIENKKLEMICARIKELRGKKFHELFKQWLQIFTDCGECFSWRLTDETPKKYVRKQRISEMPRTKRLPFEYVNQYRNGGMEGDDFGGQVWIPIKKNLWFTMHYSM